MEERGWLTWFMWKTNKFQTRNLHHLCWATGSRLNSGGCPTLGSLSHGSQKPGQVSRLGEPPRSKGSAWKGEGGRGSKRKNWHGGGQACAKTPSNFIIQKVFIYPKFYLIEDTESCRGSSPDPFCISFCKQKVSGDLHYLLANRLVNTFWLSSLMNVDLVSPEVFFL